MRHPYLIRLDEPEDWLRVNIDRDPKTGELNEESHDILLPEGSDQLYEFNDSYFYGETGYHEHTIGYETFFIHKGEMDLFINGKLTTVGPDDIIFVPPYTAHKMIMLAKPVIWNGLFHSKGEIQLLDDWSFIVQSYPELMEEPEIQASYVGESTNIVREEVPYAERVSKYEMSAVRPLDRPINTFEFPGITMKQYTGRWENAGKTELWLADMKKGFKAVYKKVNFNTDVFYVREGEVKFAVAGEEFVAGPRCVVKVPHFAPREFEALTDAKMFDMGGSTHWLDFFTNMRSISKLQPEKLSDKEYIDKVFSAHECKLQSVTYNGTKIL